MAYKQSPLAYSRTSNMPGLEYSEEDLAQKERIASNALGITPPADLLDGEFFLKDNDPQDFYRTLYIKRGESLDKVVTFTNTGKAIFDGVNEINLSDDEEVKGVLPKKKIITATATVPMDNIQNIVAFDGKKFQEVAKADLTNKIVEQVNAGIDLTNYFNKTKDKINLTSQVENILPIAKGGTGTNDGFGWKNVYTDIEFNAKIGLDYPFTTQELATAIINTFSYAPVFCMVAWWRRGENYITDFPSSVLSNRTIINFADGNQFYLETVDPFNLTTYICNVSGGIAGPWIRTRNADGTIPMEVGGTPLTYTNSDGTWTETKLSTGKTMLEGWGVVINHNSNSKDISYPKSIKSSNSMVQVTKFSDDNDSTVGANGLGNRINIQSFTLTGGTDTKLACNWYFRGILAQ